MGKNYAGKTIFREGFSTDTFQSFIVRCRVFVIYLKGWKFCDFLFASSPIKDSTNESKNLLLEEIFLS